MVEKKQAKIDRLVDFAKERLTGSILALLFIPVLNYFKKTLSGLLSAVSLHYFVKSRLAI